MKFFIYLLRCSLVLFLTLPFKSFATHNRAGEIQVEYIDNLTCRATIITYTKTSSVPADRPQLQIFWGDGKNDLVQRSNDKVELLPNDIKKNIYVMTHQYDKYGNYTVSTLDPNRNGGILNVNFPQSDAIPFYIQTSFILSNNLKNSTPKLLNAPIDRGVVGIPFKHVVNAFDTDGDSVAFRLMTPLMNKTSVVSLYEFPDRIKAGANNKITFNELTGEFTWNSPQQKGEYAIAIQVISYRNGTAIDTTVRDMQILIETISSPGLLPEISTEIPQLLEVKAGQEVFLVLKSKTQQNPDGSNAVKQYKVTVTSGAFEVANSKAEFNNNKGYRAITTDTFRWKVIEQHARKMPYMVVFKIEDNTFDSVGIVNFYMLPIKVNSLSSKIQEFDNQRIKAYPNPANDAVTLDFEGEKESAQLEVFDITCRSVFSTRVKNQPSYNLKKENVGKGTFFVRMYFEQSDKMAVQKVVFQ